MRAPPSFLSRVFDAFARESPEGFWRFVLAEPPPDGITPRPPRPEDADKIRFHPDGRIEVPPTHP
jgi:hypothetical protein